MSEPTAPRRSDAAPVVWSVWAAMTLTAVTFVLVLGRDVPRYDDLVMYDVVLGERPLRLDWLWEQYNEHRMALPKLLYVGVIRLAGGDVRAAMLCNVALPSLGAALLILATRWRVGRTQLTDAAYPLLILHFGQPDTYLWGVTLNLVLGAALSLGLLALVVAGAGPERPRCLAVLALVGLLLPLIGANGLAFAPGMIGWLAYLGVRSWRTGGKQWLLAAVGLTVAVALYFVDWTPSRAPVPSTTLFERLAAMAQVLSTSLGMFPVRHWTQAAALVVGLTAVGGGFLLVAAARDPARRPEALGLLALMAGFVCLAVGIGWGRAAFGEYAGLANRYTCLMTPLLATLYAAAAIVLQSTHSRWARGFLLLLSLLLLWPNGVLGWQAGARLRDQLSEVERAAAAGASPRDLAAMDRGALWSEPHKSQLPPLLELLARHRKGPFRHARPEAEADP